MAWKKEVFGALPDGRQADVYTLTNAAGARARFTNLGAVWLGMCVPDRDGRPGDVLQGNGTVAQCLENGGHMGEVVGRCANRIGGASFRLNGITYTLAKNNGANNLHSGPDYYGVRLWEASASDGADGSSVAFSLHSPDGDQGYPGNADITVTYTLTEDNALKIDYRMTSDADTVANFTNHAYFNLEGHDSGSILAHEVWIDADYYTPADASSIPTGELAPVDGTPMDFRTPKAIGLEIGADFDQLKAAGGYDHNWVLKHEPGVFTLCAKLFAPVSGRMMEVWTDLPGVQFYTANGLKGQKGKDGAFYESRSGCCFETQYFPDAINKPQFAQPVAKAGEPWHAVTVYHFTTV